MNIAIGILVGIALGVLLILTRRGGRARTDPRPDRTGFAPPLNIPEAAAEPGASSSGAATLPLQGAQVSARRHTIPEVQEVAAGSEILHVIHETQRPQNQLKISTSGQVAATVETIISAAPRTVVEKSAPASLEVAGLLMEAEIINRLRAVVEESRRQYDRQADGAVRDTVGRDDVTTTTLGEMVAIPPPPRMEPTRPSSPAPMAVSTDGGPATAQQPDAAPQPPPSTSDIATPSQAAADNVSPEEMPQVISPQGPAESPAPQVASAGSPAQGQINPLAWMIGDRHLAAWFPLTDAGHSHGGLVTGVLLAIAADGALNYLGTQQRTAAMHNMPPSPAVLAGIFPQPPGRNPPPPPAPPNVPPAPGGPTPPTDGRGPTSPNAPTAPPGAAPVANPGNPAAPVQTVTAVPEAVAVHSPSVNVMLNQVGTQVRQATRAGVANAQTQSPKDLTQSVNDWVKSVQKGVQLRLGKEANSAGKTGDSFRAIKTNGAGSNLITQAINTATHGVGESIGEGAATDEKNLD